MNDLVTLGREELGAGNSRVSPRDVPEYRIQLVTDTLDGTRCAEELVDGIFEDGAGAVMVCDEECFELIAADSFKVVQI